MREFLGIIKRWLGSPWATEMTRIIAVMSLILTLYLGYETNRIEKCQAEYQEANATVQKARSEAADEDRKVIDRMVLAVASAKTNKDVALALSSYLSTRAANDRIRADNPIPQLPSKFCR